MNLAGEPKGGTPLGARCPGLGAGITGEIVGPVAGEPPPTGNEVKS